MDKYLHHIPKDIEHDFEPVMIWSEKQLLYVTVERNDCERTKFILDVNTEC